MLLLRLAYFLYFLNKSINLNVMKTSILKFGNLFLTIGLFLICLNSNSQDNNLSRQEQKEARRNEEYSNFQVIDSMIQKRNFILEADFLENGFGFRRPVLSTLNFIMVDAKNAVLQTGSDNGNMGSNGVGGATAEGSMQALKITKNLKNLSFNVRFTITSNIGIYDVFMTIYSDKSARATITGLTMGKLIYDGHIQAIDNSGAYKSRSFI